MSVKNRILAVILAAVMIFCTPLTTFASTQTVSPYTGKTYTHQDKTDGYAIHNGIDVSYHNGDIDWTKVKKNTEFAIIRVGYRGYGEKGTLVKDANFDTYIKDARANGITVGIYFYSQALDTKEAIEEANKAIEYLGANKIDLPIFYDYEFAGVSTGRLDSAWTNKTITTKEMTENALAFMDTISQRGYTAMLYSNPDFMYYKLDRQVIEDAGYGVWLANYTTKTSYKGNYVAWQYADNGKVDGISGSVDCNFWYSGSDNDLIDKRPRFKATPISNQVFDGKKSQPNTTVTANGMTLTAGTDYYIIYTGNDSVGTATATITGINDYADYAPIVMTFDIVPKATDAPKITDITTNSMTVKWNAVKGATNYRVQVYRSGEWKTYAVTADTKMTITGLASATNYSIRVCAYSTVNKKEYAGAYGGNVKDATVPATPTLTYSSTDTTVTLNWKKQTNASGYRIYKYNFSTKKYTLYSDIKSGSTASKTITGLSANTKYGYRIIVYKITPSGTEKCSAYSATLTTYTKPKAPTLSTLSSPSKKKLKPTWKKVSGVTGYQVQWSTTSNFSSNYKSVNVSGASKVTTTISAYQAKKKYYVRVRTYTTRNGTKYYSKWSNTKYVTTK